jgi:hypothetical protein
MLRETDAAMGFLGVEDVATLPAPSRWIIEGLN